MNSSLIRTTLVVLMVAALAGCSTFRFPGVHRIVIQQGNVVTQQMIDRLKPGMTRSQVRFVLGNAVVDDSLDVDRWDYIYSIELPNGEVIRKDLSVYFVEDRLSHFSGDFVPTDEYKRVVEASSG